jgi:dUTP pyrophosphatase
MKIRVINKSKHKLPGYSTEGSAGMDLKAKLENNVVIKPIERIMANRLISGNYGWL